MSNDMTVVGSGTHITGNLEGDEDLKVFGRVDGNISLSKALLIDSDGIVVADVQASEVTIDGCLVGNVVASGVIDISPSGRVVGDLSAPRVIVAEGAAFRGNIDMGDLDAPRPAATRRKTSASDSPRRTVSSAKTTAVKAAPAKAKRAPAKATKSKAAGKSKKARARAKAPKPPTAAGRKGKARRK
jgi:cytoskeletal protein CcmA (bactofilin family)